MNNQVSSVAGTNQEETLGKYLAFALDYHANQHSLYSQAQNACHRSRARLSRLDLSSEEQALLAQKWNGEAIVAKIGEVHQEQEKKLRKTKLQQKSSDFVNNFCKVVDQMSAIVQLMLPQSPEYTVTLGMLLILFKVGHVNVWRVDKLTIEIQSVNTKREREESLAVYLEQLSFQLPVVDFYEKVIPTNRMKVTVATIYVELMNLLDEALLYYRSGRLSKIFLIV